MRSWAHVACPKGMKPSPLRQDITIEAEEFPSLSAESLTPDASMAALHSAVLDQEKLTREGQGSSTNLEPSSKIQSPRAAKLKNTSPYTASVQQQRDGSEEELEARGQKEGPGQGQKEAAREAIDTPIGSGGRPAASVELFAEKKKLTRKEKVKLDKGKGVAVSFEDSESEDEDSASPADFRLRRLFGAKHGWDVTLAFKKGSMNALAHRDILVTDSTWFAEHLPPADANGKTFLKMDEYDVKQVGPIIVFLYNGFLVGMKIDRGQKKWDARFVLFNAMNYRTCVKLDIDSGCKYFLENVKEAVEYYGPLLSGRFYHYQFTQPGLMESFEMPIRMAMICIYEEKKAKPEEIRKMKLLLAKLVVITLPFWRRQPAFKDPITRFWSNLNFPWREDMKLWYSQGLLDEYAQIFDRDGNWLEEEEFYTDVHLPQIRQQQQQQQLGIPGPSTAAPSYYIASIDEMAKKMRDAHIPNF
uniref:BTB domain-containing protein n=1 Tax=Colletotrichum fructicola (strain Nara gc5) TaxID=1213859 RepID=L2GE29_COLFN